MFFARKPYFKPPQGRPATGTSRHRAMTLVETVIALSIAVVLIVAILTSVVVAARLFTEAAALTNATNIINQEVENLRSLTFDNLKTALNVPTDGSSAQSPATPKVMRVGNREYQVSRTSCFPKNVVPAAGGTATVNSALIETTVTVTWTIQNKSHSTSTTTSFSSNGYAAKS